MATMKSETPEQAARRQLLDPCSLLPSPPGVGDAAPPAVFAGEGVFNPFSPGATDPIPIVPWDDECSDDDFDDDAAVGQDGAGAGEMDSEDEDDDEAGDLGAYFDAQARRSPRPQFADELDEDDDRPRYRRPSGKCLLSILAFATYFKRTTHAV